MNLACIAEKEAKLVRWTTASLVSDRLLIRKFENINPTYIDALAEILRFRTSLTNKDDGKRHYTVTDPLVDNQKQEGIWRCVSVRVDKEEPRQKAGTITQVLAFGYATLLIDTEARLVGGPYQSIEPERKLQRQYVALDKEKLGTILETAFESDFVEDPIIEGHTYEGKWRKVNNDPSRADDGSGILTQTLVLGWVTTSEDLSTPILLTDEKLLLSPFMHDTTSSVNAYTWEYRGIDTDYAQTLRNTISLTDGVLSAKIVKANDGSCSIRVTTESRTWLGTLSHKWGYNIVYPNFNAQQIITKYSHIPEDNLSRFRSTLSMADTNYKIISLDSPASGEGFYDIAQTQERMFIGAVTANNGVDTDYNLATGLLALLTDGSIVTTIWLKVPDADIASALTTLETAPTGYTVTGLSTNYNGTGSANITRIMVTADDSTAIELAINWPSFDSERKTYAYLGLDKTAADTLYTELQTEVDEGYKVDSVTVQAGTAGSLTVIQNISKVQEGVWESVVHRHDYTSTFGLVITATTVYLNIPYASIGTVKTEILAIENIIVLNVSDDDVGEGKANITYTWRSKENVPRSLGAIRSFKNSQFHKETQDHLWIDINLTDKDALATAVALAMAGTDPYAVAEGAEIREAVGADAGDKTGRITQRVVKEGTPDPAEYSMQESFNPHGLQEAVMVISVKEYPEIAYVNVDAVFALLQTFLGDESNPVIMKGKIQVSLNANGTFSMRGLKEGTPDWNNNIPDYVKVATSNKDLIGESKTELATGVPVADAAAIVEAAIADEDHVIDNIRMTERGQGEATIEKKQTKKSETAIIFRAIPAVGTQRAAQERTWPLVLDANLDTVWKAALTEGVSGDYVLQYRQKRILGNGMYEVSNRVEAATEVDVAAFTSEDRADITNVVEHKQDSAVIPDAENSEGVNISVAGELNALNKYNYRKSTSTAHGQQVSGSYLDRNGTTYFWNGTNCTEAEYGGAIAAAVLTTATDNSVEKRSTTFEGLFNYSIIKRPISIIWDAASNLSYGPYTAVGIQWNSDYSQYRTKTTTYTIYYNISDFQNQNDYTGGGPGSKMWRDGNQWKCIKVTKIAVGSWIDAETDANF